MASALERLLNLGPLPRPVPSLGPDCARTMSKERFNFPIQRICTLNRLSEQRKCGQFCDVTFVVGSKRVVAHRSVMSAASSYFQAMFASGMRESTAPEVRIDGLDGDAFESIVHFFYTSELACDEDDVEALLQAAHLLQVIPVVFWCCAFLKRHLDPGNCLGVARLSDALGCEQLCEAATELAADCFADVAKSEEFPLVTVEILKAVLSRKDLYVESETDLYETLMTWVRHDVETRTSVLCDVLTFVRLPLLGPNYLSDVVARDPLISGDERCCALVRDAEIYLEGVKERASKGERLFAGKYKTSNLLVSSFGPDLWPFSWRRVAHPLGDAFSLKSLASVGGRVYVYGKGRMDAYDAVSGAWTECRPPDFTSDDDFQLTASTSRLYCTHATVDKFTLWGYDADLDCWSSDSVRFEFNMRNYMFTSLVAMDDSLYLLGPDSMSHYDLTSCHREESTFDILQMESSCFTDLVQLRGRIYGVCCKLYNNDVSVCCFNPNTNAWSLCGHMTTPWNILTIIACNRQLFAICKEYSDDLCRVYSYEPATDSWTWLQDLEQQANDLVDMLASYNYAMTAVPAAGFSPDSFGVECSLLRRCPKRERVTEGPRSHEASTYNDSDIIQWMKTQSPTDLE